jgi:hypothetical protein
LGLGSRRAAGTPTALDLTAQPGVPGGALEFAATLLHHRLEQMRVVCVHDNSSRSSCWMPMASVCTRVGVVERGWRAASDGLAPPAGADHARARRPRCRRHGQAACTWWVLSGNRSDSERATPGDVAGGRRNGAGAGTVQAVRSEPTQNASRAPPGMVISLCMTSSIGAPPSGLVGSGSRHDDDSAPLIQARFRDLGAILVTPRSFVPSRRVAPRSVRTCRRIVGRS